VSELFTYQNARCIKIKNHYIRNHHLL